MDFFDEIPDSVLIQRLRSSEMESLSEAIVEVAGLLNDAMGEFVNWEEGELPEDSPLRRK